MLIPGVLVRHYKTNQGILDNTHKQASSSVASMEEEVPYNLVSWIIWWSMQIVLF